MRGLLAGKLKELDRKIAELFRFRDELQPFLHKISKMPHQADTSRQVRGLVELTSSLVPPAEPPCELRSPGGRNKPTTSVSLRSKPSRAMRTADRF